MTTGNKDMLFSDAVYEWLEHIKSRVRLSSYVQYKVKLEKNVLPYFADAALDGITADSVKAFYGQLLKDNINERYAANILSLLKMIMKYLSGAYGFVDPLAGMELPRPQRGANTAALYDEYSFQRLYKALLDKPDLTKAGILMTLFTGLRIGELCALKWEDIDLKNNVITVSKSLQRVSAGESGGLVMSVPKSRAGERIVPIVPLLAEYLRQFKADGEKYFLSGKNSPAEPRTMQYRLRSFLKKEQLPDISFREIRKMFINRCVSNGADIATLSEILGNITVQSTLPYCSKPTMDSKMRTVELAWVIGK